ncbi:SpaH/EbpB family LPXTG-anchored major pilin [Nocardioides sp. zg-ZUI104]|uniref:SpaH/EbpB family LPXTG-anchored major pilin n=1 Tax=Nocardioides faecalis TaxID=2803858 RepID=UPI001BD01012|nr:SpaH/EbpB family LPXTG-anchored major pilin [Nocardioides faecalis]MBS4752535.1 SpaH/EbpB family LPXTG-anchored major pilin [Nocardioides faecalis]
MNRRRRLLAAVGALTLGATLGMAPGANAAPSLGNIDEDAAGSITVHKHENQVDTDAEQKPDGSGDPIPSAPVAGVEFTVYEILDANGEPVDLTVPANWDHLEDLKVSEDGRTLSGGPEAPSGPWTVGSAKDVGTTGADGSTRLDLDRIGAYVVVETDAPASVVQRANPFVVTIPLPFEDGWLYDVHAYPKNGLVDITKSVTEQPADGLGLGSKVSFPVTTRVPGLAEGTSFDNYVVQDTLDERLGSVGVASVTLDGKDVDPSYYTVEVDGNTVRVEFTPDGLAWLGTQGDERLVTTFEGTVESLGDGTITNEATVFVNDPDESNGITSNSVDTNWGDVVVKKTDAASPGTGLKGAVFEVYAAADPYGADCSQARPTGSPLTVDGKSTFTSDADGKISIPGLFVSDSVNEKAGASTRCYVLKEVEAPAGFVTPSGDDAYTPVSVRIGATTSVDVTIENVQQKVPSLPDTGGQGRTALFVGGALLLALAIAVREVMRRRAAQS